MKKLLLLSVVFGLATAPVFADGDSSESLMKSGSFNDVDQNQDGVISRNEAASFSALEAVFDGADSNKDGTLDLQEFTRSSPSVNPDMK